MGWKKKYMNFFKTFQLPNFPGYLARELSFLVVRLNAIFIHFMEGVLLKPYTF